jgi:hypothetical protein
MTTNASSVSSTSSSLSQILNDYTEIHGLLCGMAKALTIIADPDSSPADIVNAYCDLKTLEKKLTSTKASAANFLSDINDKVESLLSSIAPTVEKFSGGRQSLTNATMLDVCNSVYENDGKQFSFGQHDGAMHWTGVMNKNTNWCPNSAIREGARSGSGHSEGTTNGISWGLTDNIFFVDSSASGSAQAWLPYVQTEGNAQTAGDSAAVSKLADSLTK